MLLPQLKVAEDSDEDAGYHPFNEVHTFTNIEESLHDRSTPVDFLQQPTTAIVIAVNRVGVEYVWEINLDGESLTMWEPYYGDHKHKWTMKVLYQMLLSSEEYLAMWLSDAESMSLKLTTSTYSLL